MRGQTVHKTATEIQTDIETKIHRDSNRRIDFKIPKHRQTNVQTKMLKTKM